MKWLIGLITLSVLALAGWFWLAPKPIEPVTLETKTISLGQVTVDVTPMTIEQGKPMAFDLAFTTHSVELDFEMSNAVGLKDDKGNTYQAISWSGGSGGHHLQGELAFPPLNTETDQLTLSFDNIDNQSGELTWQL